VDPEHLIWLVGIAVLFGGAIIGAIFYRNLAPAVKENDDLKAELEQARKDFDEYKSSVNSHFDKTSELVNELTHDYVKVYQHLAQGAQTLGEGRDFNNLLEQHKGRVLIAVDDTAPVEPVAADTIDGDAPVVPSAHVAETAASVSTEDGDASVPVEDGEEEAPAASAPVDFATDAGPDETEQKLTDSGTDATEEPESASNPDIAEEPEPAGNPDAAEEPESDTSPVEAQQNEKTVKPA